MRPDGVQVPCAHMSKAARGNFIAWVACLALVVCEGTQKNTATVQAAYQKAIGAHETPSFVKLLKDVIRLDPNHADAHANLARALLHTQPPDAEGSIRHFRHVLRLVPGHAETSLNLGKPHTNPDPDPYPDPDLNPNFDRTLDSGIVLENVLRRPDEALEAYKVAYSNAAQLPPARKDDATYQYASALYRHGGQAC